jgi:hypothetical protein
MTFTPLSTMSEAPPAIAEAIAQLLESLHLRNDRLTPSELERVAAEIAARPELWADLVVDSPDQRWWLVLHNAGNYEVRVLSWESDQESDWHDHGGSSGGFCVTSGRLNERYRASAGASIASRQLGESARGCFGPAHVHDMGHAEGHPAVSIHAYSPPLKYLTMYDETRFGLVVREVRVDDNR